MRSIAWIVLAGLLGMGTWGCEIWVKPPHGKIVISPGHHHDDDGSHDRKRSRHHDDDSSDDHHRPFKK